MYYCIEFWLNFIFLLWFLSMDKVYLLMCFKYCVMILFIVSDGGMVFVREEMFRFFFRSSLNFDR